LPFLSGGDYLWIHDDFIEIFPALPAEAVGGYILLGASIFMQTIDGIKPLRLARVPGELIQPHPTWKLNTGSVVPEIRMGWNFPAGY
jgi:hypothetical protein